MAIDFSLGLDLYENLVVLSFLLMGLLALQGGKV